MGVDSVGGSSRGVSSYSGGQGVSSTGTQAASNTVAAEEAAKAQTAVTATTPRVDFSTSSFSAAPATGLQAPQLTARALQPTPVSQQATLQAPNFNADVFDPNPMGPLGTFQGTAVSPTPVGGLATDAFTAPATVPIPRPRPEGLGVSDLAPATVPIPRPRPEGLGVSDLAPATAPIPRPRPEGLGQTTETADIRFGDDAVPGAVSEHSRQVLSDIMATAGVDSVRITSTARTPEAQARAMYDNLQSQGVQAQRDLYGRYGDQVIDAYEESVAAGLSREETLQSMVDRINEVGPSNVSRHLADPAVRNIIDISPRSIPEDQREAFMEAIRNHPDVTRFLGPADGDPAYHVEIRQPGAD